MRRFVRTPSDPWTALVVGVLACALAAPGAAQDEGPAVATPPAEARTLAVLPVTAERVPFDELAWLQVVVREETSAVGGFELQSDVATVMHLRAARDLGASCERTNVDCLVKVGILAGVAKVVGPAATTRDDGTVLDLRLIDVETGEEERRVIDLLVGDDAARRSRVAGAVRRLLAPDRSRGAILVECPVDGAEVFVDGGLYGRTPFAWPIADLAAGDHVVRAVAPDHQPFEATVTVRAGETLPVKVDLVEIPKPEPRGRDPHELLVGFAGGSSLAVCGTGVACFALSPLLLWMATGVYLETRARDAYRAGRERAEQTLEGSPAVVVFLHDMHEKSANLAEVGSLVALGGAGLAAGGLAWTGLTIFPIAEVE